MQNYFGFLLAILMAATSFPGDAMALPTSEAEITISPEQSNDFMNALPQVEGPVIVTASFALHDINNIDDEAETFEFTGVLKLSWHDPRQAFDPAAEGVGEKIYQGHFQFNEIFTGWFPQVVLVNESGLYEKQGALLRVRPDGSMTLFETINAVAKVDLDLRRYPLDSQRLEAVFEVLGFDSNEVVLRVGSGSDDGVLNLDQLIRMPQWYLTEINSSIGSRNTSLIGNGAATSTSTFIVSMDMQRRSFFIFRLVLFPMMIIVMLSWVVFWMDKSSLGDRLSISFIGILTVVSYQILLGETLPRIAYFTLTNGFMNASFLIMCISVVVNLRVGNLDRRGLVEQGDRLDRLCRWIFPISYFGTLLVFLWMSFFFLPSL